MIEFILLGLVWTSVGTAGFVYYWTVDNNLWLLGLPFALFIGATTGPLAWIIGRSLHGPRRPPKPRTPRKPIILIHKKYDKSP